MIHEHIRNMLGERNPVILDIGCNDGADTRKLLEQFGPNARAYCFEPDPRAQARFEAETIDPRARLFKMALGSYDGRAQFWQSGGAPYKEWHREGGWDYSGSLRRPKNHLRQWPWCTFDPSLFVDVHRLDTWAVHEQVHDVDLIWADVQGAEGDLIEGGRETLARTRYLYTEYNDREMYEGQITFDEILKKLPWFRVVDRFADDVLLWNSRT